MNTETLYSIKPEFISGDVHSSIVANDSLNLFDSLQGRRKPTRIHNHRRNTGKIIWNDETKQVEIQDDPLDRNKSHEGSNDNNLQQSPMINSLSLINRFENSAKHSMPPIIRTNRSHNQVLTKKTLNETNSSSVNGHHSKEDHDDLSMMKLYEDTKRIIDRLSAKVDKLEKEVQQRDQIIEKLEASQCVEQSFDKREKRLYEQRISELEEEWKAVEAIKSDNMRLKEENTALIRVISKLSK